MRVQYPNMIIICCTIFVLSGTLTHAQTTGACEVKPTELHNPITAAYLTKNISKRSPKLILSPSIEKTLKSKLESDQLLQNYYKHLVDESNRIFDEPLLERQLQGFRLLAVSREMVERMGVLCMVYRIDRDPKVLSRIDQELETVCSFVDWNNQHFLDVAEMSFAVALAVDWVGEWLPKKTVSLAKTALIEKGLKPSFNEGGTRMFWIKSTNNWNAVCHGGMITAAIVTADIDPDLSAKAISRALDKLPGSLAEYAPDGIYPEGPTYWGYGTSYSVIAADALTTALGSDFGISESPGFMESPTFVLQSIAPSGQFFNFADCGDGDRSRFAVLLSWFASKTGDELFLDKNTLNSPNNLGRLAGPGMVWLSQYERKKSGSLATQWHGNGENPVAIFRDMDNDFYLGAKGGKAHLSHGNMDAGSFVFELDGIRWAIDPGNQPYYPLNKIGFNLAGHCQVCPRWTLLTKKNQGHSTITINDERFDVNGHAKIIDFKDRVQPEVTIDLTPLYFNNVEQVHRHFVKEDNRSLLIEDKIITNESTEEITWGFMTTADVQPTNDGAILRLEGKEVKLLILEPKNTSVSIISLDPPPMEIDKTIKNLKRIDIRVPSYFFDNKEGIIRVRITNEFN